MARAGVAGEAIVTPETAPASAARIFRGIAGSYAAVAAILSFGQDPRWRGALVRSVGARPGDRVLDVATGTGLVARALTRRYGCAVVGIDQSADMLDAARASSRLALVRGRAERLPFPDASFDHVTFTYLLRYVADPEGTIRELARVLKPGGRMATLEFAVPSFAPWRWLWRLYTRIGLPVLGRVISRRWGDVGDFLGGSIESYYGAHPQSAIDRYWRAAGFVDLDVRRMSLGGGTVMSATKGGATHATDTTAGIPSDDAMGSAFYALRPGGWRDYWTLLHPPYTLWHLSYVALGASAAANPDPRIVLGALAAFGIAVGVGAHAFDERRGHPLATRIPDPLLLTIGLVAIALAALIGVIGATLVGPGLLAFVAVGVALVLGYGLELPGIHSDLGFAISWGAFPALTASYAVGAPLAPALALAAAAALLSLAQRRLSTRVRAIRRRARAVSGEVRYVDGSVERLDAHALIAAPEAALRLLWITSVLVGAGALLARWIVAPG